MSSAASGIIEAIKDQLGSGTAWDQIPLGGAAWFTYGGGGIGGWGTLCGIPNGCALALNMCGKGSADYSDVLGKYSETAWPTDQVCIDYDNDGGDGWVKAPIMTPVVQTVSNSPLCHVSISKWCEAAGVNLKSTDPAGNKGDRCGKICADMAAFTCELINDGASYNYTIPAETAGCMECHFGGSDAPAIPAQNGKMDCAGCHGRGPNGAVTVGPGHAW